MQKFLIHNSEFLIKIYGDERISTGIQSHDKRVAVRNRYKSRSLLKINDNELTLKAA